MQKNSLLRSFPLWKNCFAFEKKLVQTSTKKCVKIMPKKMYKKYEKLDKILLFI